MKRSQYTYQVTDDAVTITDCDGALSVTNDVEHVIDDLVAAGVALDSRRIVYCDSEGRWDGIETIFGKFLQFRLLAARSADEAIHRFRNSYRCPKCGRVSHLARDRTERFCAVCGFEEP